MLEKIDLSQSLTRDEYIQGRTRYQLQLRELAYQLYVQKRTLVIVYEGWDAGGKGGEHQARHRKVGPPWLRGFPHRGTQRRGCHASLSVALLAPPQAARRKTDPHFRPDLVRTGHGGAGRGVLHRR